MTAAIDLEKILAPWDRANRGAVALGVASQGRILARHEVGLANIEHQVQATATTRFQIASLSKQFLGALALLLAREGRLDLDADARTQSLLLERYSYPITVRQLLSHTSGVMDTFDMLSFAGAQVETPVSIETIAALFRQQQRLNFRPGEGFAYSNGGFEITAAIFEALQGTTLAELYQKYLFGPLGMSRTVLVNSSTSIVEAEANGYLIRNGQPFHATHGMPFNGSGGVLSSLDDMLRWESYLIDDPVGRSTLDQMESLPLFTSGAPSIYGLGTYVDRRRPIQISGHGGLLPGFVSSVVRSSKHRVSVVVLANTSDLDANGLARRVLGDVTGVDLDVGRGKLPLGPGRYYDEIKNEQYNIRDDGDGLNAFSHGWKVPLLLDANDDVVLDDPLLDGRFVGPEFREMKEWGRLWPLTRIEPPADLSEGLARFVGSYQTDGVPTVLSITDDQGQLNLEITGRFGASTRPLNRIAENVFLARSPPGVWMPFEMLICFRTIDGQFEMRVTTDRTKGIAFIRS